jgi:serine/threonine protein kinase
MEYVEGPSLREVIDRYGITFPIPAAVNVLRGILEALAAAHQAGLIHRDLKPPNVLLNHPLETIAELLPSAVKVTDFGLGKIGGSTTQSIMQSGSLLTEEGRSISGTLAYMSPEQREGGELDARSDLYSCGVVLFEMLTGERPQGGEAPSSLRVDAPRFLDEVFERCYARRERRYGSAQEVLSALTRGRGAGGMRPRASTRDGAPTCPRCGGSVHRQDHYCVHCGEQLVAAVPRCRSCRAYVHGGDRFCIFCGQDLRVMVG